MNKLTLSILCLLAGFAAGMFTGNAIREERGAQPPAPRPSHYYYWLNDSTIVRHAISGSDSTMVHRVDTLQVESLYAGSDAKHERP